MHVFKLGSLYHPARTSWPEGVQYLLRGGQHELLLFWPDLDVTTIAAVRRGVCEFAILVEPPAIWFLYQFDGACRWSDAPFSIHLVPEHERGPAVAVDELRPVSRALLQVILVDASTGIVRAIRGVTLSPEVTAALHGAINEQLAAPWDQAAYEAAIEDGYRRWPDSEALLASAQARCVGGSSE